MKLASNRLSLIGVLASILAITYGVTASAHVVVRPAEAVTASFVTFVVGVPNEKDIPTTSVELVMPEGLQHVSLTQKDGWQVEIEKSDDRIKSITWSGSTIDVGFRDEFTFSAKVPDNAVELKWKAYQTYSDGTTVSWDQADDSGHGESNTGPYSVTEVVTETDQAAMVSKASQDAAEAKRAASTALYAAVAGVVVGLAGVYFATRKK